MQVIGEERIWGWCFEGMKWVILKVDIVLCTRICEAVRILPSLESWDHGSLQ